MSTHYADSDPYRIQEEQFIPEQMAETETLFSLGNGYIGLRAAHEEEDASWWRGCYLNGFYESGPIVYGEHAYAYADRYQTILNVSDPSRIDLSFEGERFSPLSSELQLYRRTLDMSRGCLERCIEWKPAGFDALLRIESTRILSQVNPHLLCINYRVRMLRGSGKLFLSSLINADVRNLSSGDDPRTGSRLPVGSFITDSIREEDDAFLFQHRSGESGLCLSLCARHKFSCSDEHPLYSGLVEDLGARRSIACQLDEGGTAELFLLCAYLHGEDGQEEFLEKRGLKESREAWNLGFPVIQEQQEAFYRNFWEKADIRIEHDSLVQQSLRFNLFHLLQSAGRDGSSSLAAKGLSGEGYEGHYFWDTESYALPFFTYVYPELARSLLEYRYKTLPAARSRAAQLSFHGALYPWRTINGNEASAYFPAGTAQFHINADIAFAVSNYLYTYPDDSFLEKGCEILAETARFWLSLGDYIPSRGMRFCINCVTGPDEYTALVDNNYYTNSMARENLYNAVHFLELLESQRPESWERLCSQIALRREEPEAWTRAADAIYLPEPNDKGVLAQDDSFLQKARWELADIPPEKRPLLLHYHPLVIYRYQILKQSDLVFAQVLLHDQFSRAQKKRDFDYYDPITTADSSLSPCIQGVMAAELAYMETSYRHFMRSIRMDLDNINGNVRDGIHTASMAGSWISIVYGFAGFRNVRGRFSFAPRLPSAWKQLSFSLSCGSSRFSVSISHEECGYRLLQGPPVCILHEGREHRITGDAPLVISSRPELEAVIFDLDGVVCDSAEYHYRAWNRLCEELAIPFDREYNHLLKGVSRRESLELILRRTKRSFSEEEKGALCNRKNEYYKELISRLSPSDLLPGIDELLSELRHAGIRSALASASRNAPAILEYLGASDRFDVISDPERIVMGKPDPEQFFLAAEMLELPCRNCIGIEDSQAGIDAINSAGICSLGIGNYLEGANYCLDSTEGLSLSLLREVFYRNL